MQFFFLFSCNSSFAQHKASFVSSETNTGGGVLNKDYRNEYTRIAFVCPNSGPVTISKYL